jgi:hypothetical protein
MKSRPNKWRTIKGLLLVCTLATLSAGAQQTATKTVPVTTVVSVEARHGKDVPVVNREDVRVYQGHDRLAVTDWVPLQGSQAGLELFVLIDEASGADVAMQFDDVRKFLDAQPPTTAVAVGYMSNGDVRIAQNFSNDHAAVGKALRIPLGAGAGGNSPYLSVSSAIKRWPTGNSNRRVILLVSDGIDPMQPGISNSYLDAAIEQAQRTGTQVYSIYASGAGHFGHTLWRINTGQSNLSRLADETGGEAYFQGYQTPIAFAPYLEEFSNRLSHQYKLTFQIKSGDKPSYQHVRLETEVPNAELVTANKVFVPAAK